MKLLHITMLIVIHVSFPICSSWILPRISSKWFYVPSLVLWGSQIASLSCRLGWLSSFKFVKFSFLFVMRIGNTFDLFSLWIFFFFWVFTLWIFVNLCLKMWMNFFVIIIVAVTIFKVKRIQFFIQV